MRITIGCALSALLCACASAPKGEVPNPASHDAAGKTNVATACPTPERDLPEAICRDLPEDYGLSREHPVEWGARAASGVNIKDRYMPVESLYFGRLICQDGSDPRIVSRGMDGPALAVSTAARDPKRIKADETAPDIIDFWRLWCGDTLYGLYSNSYRCGSPCVPSPFKLIPAEAHAAYEEGKRHRREGRMLEALHAYQRALDLYPESVRFHEAVIRAHIETGDLEAALAHADAAMARFPREHYLRYLKVATLGLLERFDDANEEAHGLFRRTHLDDPIRISLHCLVANLDLRAGNEERGRKGRELACKLGAQECCDLKDEKTEPARGDDAP